MIKVLELATSCRCLKIAYTFYFLGHACLEWCVLFEAKEVSSVIVLLLSFALTSRGKGRLGGARPSVYCIRSLGAHREGCGALGCPPCGGRSEEVVLVSGGSAAYGKQGPGPVGPGEVDGHCMVSAGQHGVRLSALQFSEKYLIEWRSGKTNNKNAIPNKIWGKGGLNPDCCRELVSSHQNVTPLFRHRSETTATV